MPFIGFSSPSHTHDIIPYLGPAVRTRILSETVQVQHPKPKLYIPLFIYPNWWTNPSNYAWTPLFNTITSHPDLQFVVTVNVNSGPDGPSGLNDDYVHGLTDLYNAGQLNHNLTIIGYVYTSYGARLTADVNTDIDYWVSLYGTWIDGIFLDEMANTAGHETYYTNITNYSKLTKGLLLVMGNPGTSTLATYIGTVDSMFIAEDSPILPPGTMAVRTFNGAYDPSNFAAIAHGEPSLDPQSVFASYFPYVGYLLVTDDVMPNPYDVLPSYLNALADLLEGTIPELLTRTKAQVRLVPQLPITVAETIGTIAIKKRFPTQTITVAELALAVHRVARYLFEEITLPSIDAFVPEDFEEEDFEMGTYVTRQVINGVLFIEPTIHVTDLITYMIGSSIVVPEVINVDDTPLDRVMTLAREIADDIISVFEEPLANSIRLREIFDELLPIEDLAEMVRLKGREIFDVFEVLDAIDTFVSGFIVKTLHETVDVFPGVVTRQTAQMRDLEDTDWLTDEVVLAKIKSMPLDEVLESTDLVERLLMQLREAFEEEIVDDTDLQRVFAPTRATEETLTAADLITVKHILGKLIQEIIAVDDADLTRLLTQVRALTEENVTIGEVEVHKIRHIDAQLADTVGGPVTDEAVNLVILTLRLFETMNLTEEMLVKYLRVRNQDETITLIEQLGRIKNYLEQQLLVPGARQGAGGVALQRYDFILGDAKIYHKTGKNVITQKKVGGNVG